MPEQSVELSKIASRLERVEKENRRIKQAALGVCVLVCAAFLMGQARPNRTIEAERFVVKDTNGKVRAAFGMEDGKPGGATLTLGSAGISRGEEEKYVVYLHGGDLAWLLLRAPGSSQALNARVGPPDPTLPSPQLSLVDGDGYQIDIGKTGLLTARTGQQENSSAASLVLFNKDKQVVWKAP